MIVFDCSRCETRYPREYVEQWGQNGVGDGYGTNPVCTAIIEDVRMKAGAVCRGAHMAATVPDTEEPNVLASLDGARFSRPFTVRLSSGEPYPITAEPVES